MATSHGEQADRSTPAQYVVVARRYRPQSFEQLIGQEHVARALTGAIAANRVGHAYLFTGARGVGKTSAARILAKALDCVQGPTATPCNVCDICQSIGAGSDVDVLEIDGASNRGIDEIRQLRQNVNVRPSRARYKIYIIDEVHMLTREAFNALLKTLEEPPEHVKFIFCTTEANKIPITILSRCQRFDFAGIELGSIVERLSQIVAAEGATAEPAALALLARRANGSMRDSQSLLEQLLAFGQSQLTVRDVHSLLGTAGEARLAVLVDHLVQRNAAGALAELDQALSEGVDVGQLIEQLLGAFRDLMTAAVGCPADTLLHTSVDQHARLAQSGKQIGLETILAIMQVLDHALSRLRYSTQGRTLAEMALVRIAHLENVDELTSLIAELRGGAPLAAPASHNQRPASPHLAAEATKKKLESNELTPASSAYAATPSYAHESAAPGAINGAAAESAANAPADEPVEEVRAPRAVIELTSNNVHSVWQQALATLSDLLPDNAGLCDSVSLRGPGRLAVAFRAKYTACRAFCERPDQLAKLERALADVVGATVRIEFTTLPDQPTAAAPARRGVPNRQRMAEKAEHPMVKRATELFDARLLRIEEPEG